MAVLGPPALTAFLVQVASPRHATNVAFAYLLVVLMAARGGIAAGLVASVVAFVLFNLFFIEPLHSLAVSTRSDAGVLVGFFATAAVVSTLVATAEKRRGEAEQRTEEITLLYDLSSTSAEPATQAVELRRLAQLVEHRLALESVAIGVRRVDSFEVARDGGRSFDELLRFLTVPTDTPAVTTARLADGAELALMAFPKPGHSISERQLRLLAAIAALAATAADRLQQQQQHKQVEILKETDRARSALLSSVSHDLRTPLASISAAASALRGYQLGIEERRQLADAISTEGDRLTKMVSNLLDLGRIEGGALVADLEPVPVDELVGGVLSRVRPRLGHRQLTVHVPEALPQVLIDPVQIDQALGNLVDNVLEHTPVEAGLDVVAVGRAGWVTIRVSDLGPGIPAAERQLIFERFGRGSAARAGSGLGLSIARSYALASGGRLEYSDRARGSAFDLHLPAVESS